MNIRKNHVKAVLTPAIGVALLFSLAISAAEPEDAAKDRGYLGVSIARVPVKEKKELGISHGVKITDVQEKSAAEKAGLQEDDVILFFNGKKIITTDDLTDAVRETAPETTVDVKILRNGSEKTVPVTVGKYDINFYFLSGDGERFGFGVYGDKAYLGVNLHEMDKDLAAYFKTTPENGVLVLSVDEESAADEAGIKSGDVIVQVAGEDVRDADQVRTILDEFEKDDEISVTVLRSGTRKDVTVKLKGYRFGGSKFLENFIRIEDGNRHIQWIDEGGGKHIEVLKEKDGGTDGAVWKSGDDGKVGITIDRGGKKTPPVKSGPVWTTVSRGFI
ncbi:PDZ domain-containing protein [bacterium]|nr:PDZ domain-containing protein [bacterium]